MYFRVFKFVAWRRVPEEKKIIEKQKNDLTETNRLVEATKKAVRIRFIALPVACGLAAWSHLIPVIDSVYIFFILVIFTFFLWLTVKFKKGMFEVGIISVTVEIAIATWFLWYADIQFYFFFAVFMFLILAHTILESLRKGLIVATIVSCSYVSIFIVNKIAGQEPINFFALSSVIVNIIAFYGVTILAGRLSDQLKVANKNLAISSEKILKANASLHLFNSRLKEEKDKIEAILYGIGEGVFTIDKDSRITMLNNVASAISGYSLKDAIGKKYSDVLHFVNEKDNSQVKSIDETMKKGLVKKMPNYTALVKKDGTRIPVADSSAPLKDSDNKVIGAVIVFTDYSKERSIDKAKSEFVSLASHQLRTPLSTMNWYMEVMLDGDAGPLNKEQKQYLKEVYSSNRRMVELVNALLNVSRIDLGTLAVEPVPTDLATLAKESLEELTAPIKKKHMHIETHFSKVPPVKVDPKLMRIVFQNLLSNAVKYTPDKGTIKLTVKGEEFGIKIDVADNGYGIPKRQQAKMFTKLFRADNVKDKVTEGTGLGLYIIKSIVESCNGQIWFDSVENKGTTFHVLIPLKGMEKKAGSKELSISKAFFDT